MFPTAGYFRSTNCPFFVHGLCHRPYCHFRHSKPGLKASKTKISPHKASVEELQNLNKANTAVATNVLSVTKAVPNETETTELSKDNHQNSEKNKTSTSKQLRGILKRSTSEDEDHKQPSTHKDLPLLEDLDNSKTEVTALADSNKSEEPLESDDTEQPFPSLTDEEKLIIGFPIGANSENRVHDSCPEKSGDLVKESASNSLVAETVDANFSCENKIAKQGDRGIDHANSCRSNVAVKEEVKEIHESNSNERVLGEGLREETKKETIDLGESPGCENKNVDFANDKSSKMFALKRKSIHLDISLEEGTQVKTTADLLCSVSKKRKSQQLPCNVDNFLQDKKLNTKGSGFEESVINKTVTKRKFQCNSSFFEKVCDSGKLLFGTKGKHKNNTISALNENKMCFGDVQNMGEKTATKQSSAKKATISEAGIDFFGLSKNLVKQSKTDKKKLDEAVPSSSQTSKPKQSSPVKKVQETKKPDTKKPQTTCITVESSDESDICSPVFSDSSPEEEDQLKRIWNDFEPQPLSIDEKVVPSPIKKQVQVEQPTTNRATKRPLDKVDARKEPLLIDTLGLGKKQRVAHAPNHLPRRSSSNANPVRRYPKTLAAVQRKESPKAGPSVESSMETSASCQPVRKRIAHIPKNTSSAGCLPRPRIPVEYGAKVPQNQRQRYLDRIIDEYLRLCSNEKDAYEKAAAEEQALYERSTRRQVYLNLCVNSIKRLRGLTSIESNSSPAKTTAVTKTLPSGAVVISTKSPGNEHRAPPAVSNQLTEEILYNCLSNYLMSEEDLVENGYPRSCPTSPGKAIIKNRKEQLSRDSTRRNCCRCGKPFVVLEDGEYSTKEECIYHAGKLFRKRGEPITNYSCCQGDAGSPGCCVGKVHVSNATCDTDGFMATIVSPLRENNNKVFAIDCEMCYTTAGLELTRITVVNWNLERVYDSFVCPERRIVDYNTRFSGVTEESLRGVTTTIREIQAVLLSMIHKDTILVGHSLESDLKAIKLIHSKVVDTSVVFPHRMGRPYKRALRNLMAEHLNKIIQDGVDGHDSHEDAAACLELMRWKVKEDIKRAARPKGPLNSKQN